MKKYWKKVLCGALALSLCSTPYTPTIYAEDEIVTPAADVKTAFKSISFEGETESLNYEGTDADTQIITSTNATDGSKAMEVTYHKADWPGFHLYPAEGTTWDLSGRYLSYDVTNTSSGPVTLYTKFDNDDDTNFQDITETVSIMPGETTSIVVPTGDGGLKLGMHQNPPSKCGTLTSYGWGAKTRATFDYSNVKHITFWLMYNKASTTLVFDNIRTIEDPTSNPSEMYGDLIDQYGQYSKNTSSNKISSDKDFVTKKAEEDTLLDEQLEEGKKHPRSDYYGLKDESQKQEALGHFYTKKLNGKWTLIDPEGYPYLSSGIDIVRTTDALTWTTSREFLFEGLPTKDSSLGDHYEHVENCAKYPGEVNSGDAFNFYTANLERKYGDDWKTKWSENAIKRFKAWGFTSMGCWADPDLYYGKGEETQFPYVAHAWINKDCSRITYVDGTSSLFDPFDPDFKTQADAQMNDLKDKGVNTDPYCMGLYVDNEIAWGNATTEGHHFDVIKAVFNMDTTSETKAFAKEAMISKLKEKYSTIEKLNEAWGSTLESWDALNVPYTGAISDEDASSLLTFIADKYYSTVSESIHSILGNDLLYLGSRLAVWGSSSEVVQSCAKYADVVSFNCYYNDVNQDFLQLGTFDKPVIIGEFHFTASDYNHWSTGLTPVANQQARGEAYKNYMTSAFQNSQIVGAHWFQYYDQPNTGRAWDGENANCGFVDITDQPYEELVSAAKEVNEACYSIRGTYKPVDKISLNKTTATLDGKDATVKLVVTIQPSNATNKGVTWSSSNPAIATVDETGTVKAVENGTTTITVTSTDAGKKSATCQVTVTGIEDTKPITFPTVSFEEGEKSYFVTTENKDMTLTKINDKGVTNGDFAGLVEVNDLVKDPTAWNYSMIQATDSDGWNIGSKNSIKFDVTNPNDFDIQIRSNVIDSDNEMRTFYFGVAAGETKNCEMSAFGIAADNWAADGYYGSAGANVNKDSIKSISFYLYENSTDWAADSTLTKASFIIDNIRCQDNDPSIIPSIAPSKDPSTDPSTAPNTDPVVTPDVTPVVTPIPVPSAVVPVSNNISDATVNVKDTTYTGKALKPSISVSYKGHTLTKDTDYTVTYSNNINAGTGKVLITGKGKYKGSTSATFTILKKSQKVFTDASHYKKTYGDKFFYIKNVKGVGKLSYTSSNAKVASVSNTGRVTIKGIGKADITVVASGNTNIKAGSAKITITVQPKKTVLYRATCTSKHYIKATWKKASNITGYQIQYCAKSNYKKCKTITVASPKAYYKYLRTVRNSKGYYVRIRTYKTVNGQKICSDWSKAIRSR